MCVCACACLCVGEMAGWMVLFINKRSGLKVLLQNHQNVYFNQSYTVLENRDFFLASLTSLNQEESQLESLLTSYKVETK